MAVLSIDRGLKSYDICDPDGTTVGTIRFNAQDLGLAGRWKEAEEAIRDLANTPIDSAEALVELDRSIKAQLDKAIGMPVSDVVFQGASSLAVCEDGQLVIENVLSALSPVILNAQKAAVDTVNKRIASHTEKYQGSAEGLAPGQK